MPINGTYRHDPTTLTGANVWMLQYLADAGNMNVVFETVFLSDALFYGSNRTAQLAYLFDVLGYDCMFTATPLRGAQMLEANFLMPNEEFGLTVVTALTGAGEYTARDLIFAWAAPFEWRIWITVVCSLLFGAMAMFCFEGGDSSEDYGDMELALFLRVCRGWYKAFLNFSAIGGFNPTTPAGQMFNIPFSFGACVRRGHALHTRGATAAG